MLDFKQILPVSLILFSVIDILGSIPIVINLRKKVGHIKSERATLAAGLLMIVFLLVGESILRLFGIGVSDFAIAGALIIFALGAEMILGIELFKPDPEAHPLYPDRIPFDRRCRDVNNYLNLEGGIRAGQYWCRHSAESDFCLCSFEKHHLAGK
ncbi:MarC family integral membrane protein [Algoriphagus alkaliphilus]|uniref:UPF0056 membrane protein n=1 Tax=Algoriphagus alkaliphilus TaxID=279824 RepID=A0A1G5WRV9_9BACT|nr:MarC family integral membrane protein [Algoriphagus alkaliphilus]